MQLQLPKKIRKITVLFIIACCFTNLCAAGNAREVQQWAVCELSFKAASEGNPYIDNWLEATFTLGSKSIKVPGFYDGEGIYKIRFSPDMQGYWTYKTQSNLLEISNRNGTIRCIKPAGSNHGPVKIVNTYYFEYADGNPFYSVGTTAYQWTSVKQSIQERTVKTLAVSPFTKVRMCVFPKHYSYGNDTEPWILPFKIKEEKNDPTQPNYEFFQNFDKRVEQLMQMGIQADVILFHPYDSWGYSKMDKEMNAKYVRYMIARISAYRNVWWSLANEWDVPAIKNTIEWEGIGNLLQKEDPYQRLRSIHNWYYDESHFYNPNSSWVTHVSMQTYFFFNAVKWRTKYKKPLLFDEMRYEGDVPSGWGRLTAKEMTSYFWMAGLSGGYGMHSETFKNDADQETEVRWWAKGGTLTGKSPERIAFFRKIMEEAPVTKMTPAMVNIPGIIAPDTIPDKNDGVLVDNLNNNVYSFFRKDKYYLAYTTGSAQVIALDLGGTKNYTMEVIDTWNMRIKAKKLVRPGRFEYITEMPFTAIRLIAK